MCQIRNFRICPGRNVKCAREALVCLPTHLGYLSTETRPKTIVMHLSWYYGIPILKINDKLHFNFLSFSFSSYDVRWSTTNWGLHPTWLLYFEHIFFELVNLNFIFWMKSTSSSSHLLHNKILEKLILANINIIYDQNSSSWTQRTFRHPSIGSSAQPQLPFSKLST